MALLDIKNLNVSFTNQYGTFKVVDNLSLNINAGEIVGLVGESGCGKSATAMSVVRLLPSPPASISAESITYDNKDLSKIDIKSLREIRGKDIGVIFQDPMTALSPLHKIKDQLIETLLLHEDISKENALLIAKEYAEKCGLPQDCLEKLPSQLSGGQQQRVMIATVLVMHPKIVIADEPTTALDASIQKQVLDLMINQKDKETAVVLITHDMTLVEKYCDKVAIMYAGQIVEYAQTSRVFSHSHHPYTQALINAMPTSGEKGSKLFTIKGSVPSPINYPSGCRFAERCDFSTAKCFDSCPQLESLEADKNHNVRCFNILSSSNTINNPITKICFDEKSQDDILLETRNITKSFKKLKAVNGVSINLKKSETLAIVGESGCGKTTLARIIAGLLKEDTGSIIYKNKEINQKRSLLQRKQIQMVFQNPFSSFNPRMKIKDVLTEAPLFHKIIEKKDSSSFAIDLLNKVGLDKNVLDRFPHEFSGGQLQRISIARAIAMQPEVLICDEPVSALDVSIQAQILNLLLDLRDKLGLSYLFITHDLGVVSRIADRIAIMQKGVVIEEGLNEDILQNPSNSYTKKLLESSFIDFDK